MPSRRKTLLAGGTLLLSTFAGCLDTSRTTGSFQQVRVELHNGDYETHTFHFALELESGVMEWESNSVGAESAITCVITPPEDSFPVALHATVDEFAHDYQIWGIDTDEDYCVKTVVQYRVDDGRFNRIMQLSDTS